MLSTRKTARKIQARHIALPFSGKPQFYRPQERLSKQAQATPPGHFRFHRLSVVRIMQQHHQRITLFGRQQAETFAKIVC
ncbi:hypothetical protein [Neisseria meningitidis]|uniref:hypothetical protein n=1 Tax=Neisseria meningitidis TaxID=487 RepID=UPI0015D5650E|nr:hypothetical protein [Neisseria meningitidis]